ncbi:MAG: DUF814 domain-containing protein [Melioribacteraceae bacterium]|nr:DUF814 domain-containing protein [Melioribacteraceae bacterium]
MFRNYFFLNRIIVELNNLLPWVKIRNAFTQERDRLYLDISTEDFPNRHLIISADQNVPFISIKKEHHRAKKNTVAFFNDFFPDTITGILISKSDRVIKIELQNSNIYFLIRGNGTNIVIENNDGLSFFKKSIGNQEELLEELSNIQFTSDFNYPGFDKLETNKFEPQIIKSAYPFINKDILNEYKVRYNTEDESFKKNIKEVISDIFTNPLVTFIDEIDDKVFIKPKSFTIFNKHSAIDEYDSAATGLNGFLSKKFRFDSAQNHKKIVEKFVEKELNKLSSKLNQLKSRIDLGSNEVEYKRIGQLLLNNYHLLKKGLPEVNPIDFETGKEESVKIDPKKAPQQNIDFYFDKSKNERINFQKSIELHKLTLRNYNKFLELKKTIDECEDPKILISLREELKIKDINKVSSKMEDIIKFKEYILEDKYHVYVGKDSKSNDLLTVKFAKQNDYWFHARGLPGSHTVLRIENTKEAVPKSILKGAASIAAFHSKAKTAKVAPVSYTFAKFVYKKKGMAPGKVLLTKESVMLVKPEIPKNCIFVEE